MHDGCMFLRGITGWFAILVVAVVNGGLRDRYVRPRFGFFPAEVYGAGILSLAVLVSALLVMRPAAANGHYRAACQISALWLVLTLAFEFLFFHFVGKHSWSELCASYRFWEGRLWSVVVLVVALAPFFACKWLSA